MMIGAITAPRQVTEEANIVIFQQKKELGN